VELRKSISIIIPNYNGRQLLETYLPFTIEAVKVADIVHEIIIVDDCSTDDSVQFIKSVYPTIKLIVNTENKGFSYSCNRGLEVSQHELILLLNSDVKLLPDYFEHQWKYFLSWDTFGVMGRIIDMEGDHIQDAARVPKFNGFKLKTDYFYYTSDESNRLYNFYLSGANALINAAKLKQIGGFYEIFSPFYCEDMELSIRAWRLKWKCYYEHRAVCRHQVSASTKNYQTAQWVKSVYYRNRFYVHAIHLEGWRLAAWYFQITFIDLIPKLLAGQSWIWKSYKDLFTNRKLIKEYKTRVKVLLAATESHSSIFKVVAKIRKSVINKKQVRFKP
jgi:GT2 family glycosyltransferase